MSIKETKDQARTLVQSLQKIGIRLKHHQAIEVMSQVKGTKGWNELRAGHADSNRGAGKPTLSAAHQALLEEAVDRHMQTIGLPDQERPVRIVMSGNPAGNLNYIHGYYLDHSDNLEIGMALNQDIRGFYGPETLFMSAVLANKDGKCVVDDFEVYDWEELENRVVAIDVKWNNAAVKSICPLTLESHKPYIGFYPFLADTWSPIDRDIVPSRVWLKVSLLAEEWEANEDEILSLDLSEAEKAARRDNRRFQRRVIVTVGEILDWILAEQYRMKEKTDRAPSVPSINTDDNLPF